MRTLASLLLVCTIAAIPVAAAPPESVSTATAEPSAKERIEREFREAMPIGVPVDRASSWLYARGAKLDFLFSSASGGVLRLAIRPSRHGLAVPGGTVLIDLLFSDTFGARQLQKVTVTALE